MQLDICLDCGKVQQPPGNLFYTCSKCDRVTWHALLLDSVVSSHGYRKEDFDLENHFCGGL